MPRTLDCSIEVVDPVGSLVSERSHRRYNQHPEIGVDDSLACEPQIERDDLSDETSCESCFGLLAVQVGLIDQDQSLEVFGQCPRNKVRAPAEILVERGPLDEQIRSPLAFMTETPMRFDGNLHSLSKLDPPAPKTAEATK